MKFSHTVMYLVSNNAARTTNSRGLYEAYLAREDAIREALARHAPLRDAVAD